MSLAVRIWLSVTITFALIPSGAGRVAADPPSAGPAPPTEGTSFWGPVAYGMQLGLALASGNHPYRIGEAFTLVIRLRNVSVHSVKLYYREPLFREISPSVVSTASREALGLQGHSCSLSESASRCAPFQPDPGITRESVHLEKVRMIPVVLAPAQDAVVARRTLRIRLRGDEGRTKEPSLFAEPGRYWVSQTFEYQETPDGSFHAFRTGRQLYTDTVPLEIIGRGTDPALRRYERQGVALAGVRANDHAALDEIARQYIRFVDAFDRSDPAALASVTAQDFLLDAGRDSVRGRRAAAKLVSWTGSKHTRNSIWMRELAVHGNRAVAIVHQITIGEIAHEATPWNTPTWSTTQAWRHTWVRTPAGWRLQRARIVPG